MYYYGHDVEEIVPEEILGLTVELEKLQYPYLA